MKNNESQEATIASSHQQLAPGHSDEPTISDLLRIIVSGRWIAISTFALCVTIAILVAFLTKPLYRADVLLVPVGEEDAGGSLQSITSQFGGLAAIGGLNISGSSDFTDEAIAILKSRSFTQEFFLENDLIPILFPDDWDKENSEWKFDNPADIPTIGDAYELFDLEIRSVTRHDNTGLVTLSMLWSDRQLAADWANELIIRLNDHMRERAATEARKTMTFLESELRSTNVVEVQQGIYRLIENELKKLMITNVREEFAFKVIDPAVPAESDDFAKPKRAMIIGLGAVGGFFLSILMPLLAALVPLCRDLAKS